MNKKIKEHFKNLIRKNLLLKIISVLFAVIIWGYVVGGTKQEVSLKAGLVLSGLPKGYALSNELPRTVKLKVEGTRVSLMKLDKQVFFNINGYSLLAKKNTVILGNSYINLPQGVKIVSVYPRIIPVNLSRIKKLYVKVLPVTSGTLPKGYYVKSLTVFPKYVPVEGPKDIVGNLAVITTMDINLNGLTGNKFFEEDLRNPTKLVKILYNKKVSVDLKVQKRP